jgi:hypothetical protein
MELPILQNDLRSSGSWATALAEEQKRWARACTSSTVVETNLRGYQIEQILKTSGEQVERARLAEAAAKISAWAKESGATFNTERLLELHCTLAGVPADADVLRNDEPKPINAAHDPTPAVLLPRMIDHAFDWFSTESFGQLHAVEQAAVVYLRLLDLYPFPTLTRLTSLLAASFYTERAGLPPLVIAADGATRARFDQALEAAMRMLTQPLVELFAEMLRLTMRQTAAPGAAATG